MDREKVSVITVVFNDAGHIESTIQNVLKQTYNNFEYVVVDGGSNDGTLDIIKKYENNLKWISEPDRGIYDAMMKGVRMASGEWVLFRNSGDYFSTPSAIEQVFENYEDKGEDFLLSNSRLFRDWGYSDQKPSILERSYMDDMPVLHPSTFMRRSTQLKYPFHLEYKNSADYCFFVEAFKNGATYRYFDITVALIDCREGATSDHYDRTLRENIDIMKKNGASASRIRHLRKVLCKSIVAMRLMRIFPILRKYFVMKDTRNGWVECALEKTLKNV